MSFERSSISTTFERVRIAPCMRAGDRVFVAPSRCDGLSGQLRQTSQIMPQMTMTQ